MLTTLGSGSENGLRFSKKSLIDPSELRLSYDGLYYSALALRKTCKIISLSLSKEIFYAPILCYSSLMQSL